MKTKYPIKMGPVLVGKGAEVRLATVEEMREIWPNMKINDASDWMAVVYEGADCPCIVHKNQLIF